MNTIFSKGVIFAFMTMFIFNGVSAQEKILYILCASFESGNEGIEKGLAPIDGKLNYQSTIYSVYSLKYEIAYPFIHISFKDRTTNLEIWDKPQSYLADIKATTVDWDVVKLGFTHKMDIISLLLTWKSYDRIFFIDRNDFYTKKSFLGLITKKRMVLREVDKDIDF